MSEFLRIFSDKKRIMFLSGLVILNLIFLLKDNVEIMDRSAHIYEAVNEYATMDIDEAYNHNQEIIAKYYSEGEKLDIDSEAYKEHIYNLSLHEELTANITYIQKYGEKYEGMVKSAGRMISTGLVGDKDTFAYENIKKTLVDFADIENLSVELVNERAVNFFMNFEMADYMIILAIIIIVASFVEEQKKGLFFIVRSTSGRNRLVCIRQVVLLISSAIISVVFYGTTYITMGIIHGFTPLNKLVQSFMLFEDCYVIMSLGEFLLIMMLLKTLVIFLLGNLFWVMLNLFNNMLMSVSLISVVLVLEYIAYGTTSENNIYQLLKYLNIFNYINIEDTYTHYYNLNILGNCVGAIPFSIISLMVITAVTASLAAIVAMKKRFAPEKKNKILAHIVGRPGVVRWGEHTRLWCHEAYRFLKCNSVLVLLTVFGVLVFTTYEKPISETDLSHFYLEEHYRHIEGQLGADVDRYLAEEREQLNKDIEAYEQTQISDEDMGYNSSYSYEEEILRTREQVLSYVEEENIRLKDLKNEGYEVCHVDQQGYMQIFEVSSVSTYVSYLIPIFFVVLIGATTFSYDNEYNFGRFLKATSRGRMNILGIRIIYVLVCTVIIWGVMNFIELYKTYSVFKPDCHWADIASLNAYGDVQCHISIGRIMVIMYLIRLVVLICVAMVSMFISSMVMNNKLSYVINLLVLVLPAAFVVIGAELFGFISYIDVYKAHGNLIDTFRGNYAAMLPVLICAAISVAAVAKLKKKIS